MTHKRCYICKHYGHEPDMVNARDMFGDREWYHLECFNKWQEKKKIDEEVQKELYEKYKKEAK